MKEAISITKQEIEWHEQNKSKAPSMVQAVSFIKGLKHLLDLFQQCASEELKDRDHETISLNGGEQWYIF